MAFADTTPPPPPHTQRSEQKSKRLIRSDQVQFNCAQCAVDVHWTLSSVELRNRMRWTFRKLLKQQWKAKKKTLVLSCWKAIVWSPELDTKTHSNFTEFMRCVCVWKRGGFTVKMVSKLSERKKHPNKYGPSRLKLNQLNYTEGLKFKCNQILKHQREEKPRYKRSKHCFLDPNPIGCV